MGYNRTLGHFTNSQELATVWASGQNYIVDQLVLDSDKLYRCNTAHTSGATFAGDSAYWTGINPGSTIGIAEGGTGQTTATAAFDALAPTTTAGDLIVYNGTDNIRLPVGTDGQMIVADASQTNKLKWATVPQGSKNYITYSNFENNATTGWSLFNTTLTSKIPTGAITSGAASLNALSVTSSTPLAGSYSLSVSSPGAVTAGQGFITDVLTIDREDQAKVLTFSFYYETVSGTMDFSGTSSNTWAIYIHDGTNWIQPAGVYGMTQSSGAGLVTGTFQTNSTGTSYRLAVVCITATGAAISMKFDDFKLSPQTAPIGPVMTDWVSYTPTWTGLTVGNANQRFFYRRNGDSIEIKGNLQFGTTTSVSGKITFTLPAGLSLDNSKNPYPLTAGGFSRLGTASIYDGGVKSVLIVLQDSSSLNTFYFAGKDGTTVIDPVNNTSYGWGTNDEIEVIELTVPISGWSSNVQLSNDTDTRVVAFAANKSATQSILNTTNTVIDFNSVEINTHGSTYAAGAYTVPVSGYYKIAFNFNFSTPGSNTIFGLLFKNELPFCRLSAQPYSSSQSGGAGSTVIYLNAGENVSIAAFQSSGSAQTLEGAGRFSVERISGPSVVAASETVAYRGNRTAGNYATNNSSAVIAFNSTSVDTHNAMNTSTGTYTVPVSGIYEVIAKATISALTLSLHTFDLFMAGEQTQCFMFQDSTNNNYRTGTVSNIRRMNAGDQISFSVYSSLASTVICNTALTNSLQIKRIGN